MFSEENVIFPRWTETSELFKASRWQSILNVEYGAWKVTPEFKGDFLKEVQSHVCTTSTMRKQHTPTPLKARDATRFPITDEWPGPAPGARGGAEASPAGLGHRPLPWVTWTSVQLPAWIYRCRLTRCQRQKRNSHKPQSHWTRGCCGPWYSGGDCPRQTLKKPPLEQECDPCSEWQSEVTHWRVHAGPSSDGVRNLFSACLDPLGPHASQRPQTLDSSLPDKAGHTARTVSITDFPVQAQCSFK